MRVGPRRWQQYAALALAILLAPPLVAASDTRSGPEWPAPGSPTSPAASPPRSGVSYPDFEVLWQWTPPGNPAVSAVAWSPNASLVAVGHDRIANRSVTILDAVAGGFLLGLDTGDASYATHFSPNGSFLAVGGNNFGVRVYSTSTWGELTQIEPGSDVWDLAWSGDGRYLSLAGPSGGGFEGRVDTFDATSGFGYASALSKRFGNGRPAQSVDWDPTSTRIAAGLYNVNGPDAFVYAAPSGTPVAEFNCFAEDNNADGCRAARYGPTTRYLALGRGPGHVAEETDVDVWVWDTTRNWSGQGSSPRLSAYTGHDNGMSVGALDYSIDGLGVASGGNRANTDVWYASNGTRAIRLPSGEAQELRFSPQGERLAVAERNPNRVTVWGDKKPPAVARVEVSAPDRASLPFYPNYVKAERAWFRIDFSEVMDTAVAPTATFGRVSPWKDYGLNASGWSTSQTWEGWFNLSATMGDGEYRLRVSGAKDTTGNVMLADTNTTLWLDTQEPQMSAAVTGGYWHSFSPLNVSVNASDADPANSSELAFVRPSWRWNNDANASWSNWTVGTQANVSGTSFAGDLPFAFAAGEGHYEFAFAVYDRATNSPAGFSSADAGFDASGPSWVGGVEGGYWHNTSRISAKYDISDAVGGVGLYSTVLLSPDNASWAPVGGPVYGSISKKSATIRVIRDPAVDGHYRFDTYLNDSAGHNVSSNQSARGGVDTVPPSSVLSALPPITNKSVFTVPFSASDALSGIALVELEYRREGGQWTKGSSSTSPSGDLLVDVAKMGGDGLFEFRARAWDKAGNAEPVKPANETWTLVDTTPPSIVSIFPKAGVGGISPTVQPRIELSEPVTGDVGLALDTSKVEVTVTWNGNVATMVPKSQLQGLKTYTIEVRVQDRAGNTLTSFSKFTTADKPDTTPPKVSSTSPSDFSVVPALDLVKVVFDEPMSPDVVAAVSVSPGSVDSPALATDERTLTFRIVPVTMETTYAVTISSAGAKDLSGNRLDGDRDGAAGPDHSFQFTVSSAAPATITVTVKDDTGRPIDVADVRVSRESRLVAAGYSDPSGTVKFPGLYKGKYLVNASKAGLAAASQEVEVAAGETKQVDLVLMRPGQRGADILLLSILLILAMLGASVFIVLYRTRKCPRCGHQRDLGKKECRKCGYPREMPTLFEGATVSAPAPKEPAPASPEDQVTVAPPPPPPPPAEATKPEPSMPPAPKIAAPAPKPAGRRPEKKETPKAKPVAQEPAPKRSASTSSKKAFDPYKAQIMTATKTGISVADEQKLADASAAKADAAPPAESEEERRKRAIDKAKVGRETKDG